jgi:hypothetical protein
MGTDNKIVSLIKKDFNLFLKEYDTSKKVLKEWMRLADIDNLIEVESENYIKKKSKIHGLGLFAKKHFKKHDCIGVALINNKRTTLGRWTNHSHLHNAEFLHLIHNEENTIIVCIAIKDILYNEEITVNYRNHINKKNERTVINRDEKQD